MKNKTNRTRLLVLIIIFLITVLIFAICALGVLEDPIKDLCLMIFYTILNLWSVGSVISTKPKIWNKLLMFIILEALPIVIYILIKNVIILLI